MGDMIREGKLRGWGMCNDNCYGLTASAYSARALGVPPPVAMQNDYSIINRRIEENGLSEAASPLHENTGFMAYNVLAGGVLTGKYLDVPAATDDADRTRGMANRRRAGVDVGWGQTLYRYRSGPADAATREYAALAKKYKMSLTEPRSAGAAALRRRRLSRRWRVRRDLASAREGAAPGAAALGGRPRAHEEPQPDRERHATARTGTGRARSASRFRK